MTRITAESIDRPNIVVFLADDQGWGDLSSSGNPNLQTPNIDSIARDGVELANFYVCPVCSPTRAEFLTGRYHPRTGVYGVTSGAERIAGDETTIADVLHDSGYVTAAYGKWHSGTQWPSHPNSMGFADFYGFCSGHWGNYFSPMLEHNGEIVRGDGFLPDDLTDHAIETIRKSGDQPYFVYLPYNTPHAPMQVPDRFYDPLSELQPVSDPDGENAKREDVLMTRAALAMVENIDWNVGRVLQTIEELDQTQETIVVYFSDNGPNSYRFNGGMRGRKGSVNEGGVRSPCAIRYPHAISPGTVVQSIAGAIDLMPTLLDLADLPMPSNKVIDGESLVQLMDPEVDAAEFANERRTIVTHWNGKISVRTNKFRYHREGRLYDIKNDRGEHDDVAAMHPKTVRRLADEIERYIDKTKPRSRKEPPRPFDVAYDGAPSTQLPARDAILSGNAKHSNRHHNCTFVADWNSLEDRIIWNVDVANAGPQKVTMYYASQQADLGCKIELRCGNASIEKVIDVANETPLFGKERDRAPRPESEVKLWQPMELGVIDLPEGINELTLRALEIPGEQVVQMRLLVLHPQDH